MTKAQVWDIPPIPDTPRRRRATLSTLLSTATQLGATVGRNTGDCEGFRVVAPVGHHSGQAATDAGAAC